MGNKKYEKCISTVKDITKVALASHKPTGAELGPLYTLLGHEVMPDSDLRVVVRHVLSERSSSQYPDYIDEHIHDVSKAYVILSEEPGNLEADLTLGDEKYTLRSPAAAFVPVGVTHNVRVTKGHGFLIIVMPMKGTYNEHTFPVSKK